MIPVSTVGKNAGKRRWERVDTEILTIGGMRKLDRLDSSNRTRHLVGIWLKECKVKDNRNQRDIRWHLLPQDIRKVTVVQVTDCYSIIVDTIFAW